jgi:hypothetical protein
MSVGAVYRLRGHQQIVRSFEIGHSTSSFRPGYQIVTRSMAFILRVLGYYCSQYIVARICRPSLYTPIMRTSSFSHGCVTVD